MKIFVTGGTGFIGKTFIKEATKKNNYIFSLMRKKNQDFNPKVKPLFGKLKDDWSKYLKETDVVVHLAAVGIQPNLASKKKVFETNVTDSLKFIQSALKAGCKKFVIVSSSSEYGFKSKKIKMISKSFKRRPKSLYSKSKVKFTDLMKELSNKKKFKLCKFRIMRLFPIYGEGEKKYRLYPTLKKAALNGKNFLIKNPLEFRDFTEVSYAAKVLLSACKFKKNVRNFEIFHVSSNIKMTVLDFSRYIWKKFKAKGKLLTKNENFFYSTHVSDKRSIWRLKKNA